jgi:hypothetical protein
MSRKKDKNAKGKSPGPAYTLPKNALSRIAIGQAFAEYDKILLKPGVFVETPAILAATQLDRSKCFFVGRRGTGKTAITYYLGSRKSNVITLAPELFATLGDTLTERPFNDVKSQHFHALVAHIKRAMIDEVLKTWVKKHLFDYKHLPTDLRSERNQIEDFDFDERVVALVSNTIKSDRDWLKSRKRAKDLRHFVDEYAQGKKWAYTLLLDRIDDTWNGSDTSVKLLMAMMHACVELCAESSSVHPILFLRENLFQRVKAIDTEFTRLSTAVVSLDWTPELLIELIERRLKASVTSAPPADETWDAFFELVAGKSSKSYILEYCQNRPRDVLILCSTAIEEAQSHKHAKVTEEDLVTARRKFSLNRLKDVGDEYSENFAHIELVLGRFHGLGSRFTMPAMQEFIQKLVLNPEVHRYCSSWLDDNTELHRFVSLLYNIGFFGISNKNVVTYRSHEDSTESPPLDDKTLCVIHPCYADALDLQDKIVTTLADTPLQFEGLLLDLPQGISLSELTDIHKKLLDQLDNISPGLDDAKKFDAFIGEMIRMCFYSWLTNVTEQSRDDDGITIKDWIASNVATDGFFQMAKTHPKMAATQVIWECKNKEELSSTDFHQVSYYLGHAMGRLLFLCFRGDVKDPNYIDHLKRIHDRDGAGTIVLLFSDQDFKVFLRQAMKGKIKDGHIHARYDDTVRAIG